MESGTALEIAARIRDGQQSAADLIEAHLARIKAIDPLINSFTDVTAERARKQALRIDQMIEGGIDPGPLAGVPFAVKNLFDIEGVVTRAGSRINRARPPADRDAELILRLQRHGAILLGALNMGEYAYDFTGENAHDGNCLNPHDRGRMTGGSSSGSAAAVAAGLVPVSLGSDTNGSIRVPSALCGIFGLKPTYGRLSRHGVFPFCDSFDHVGPMARSVGDLALAFELMQGHDPKDPVSAAKPPVAIDLTAGMTGIRVAIAGDYFRQGGTGAAHAAVDQVAAALGSDREALLPQAAVARASAYIIANSEGSALHLERLRRQAFDFDVDTRYRFLSGACLPAAWVIKAQRFRRWFQSQAQTLFRDIDVLLAPATPCSAPKSGEKWLQLGDQTLPLRPNLGIFTQPISFIGLPSLVVPLPQESGLPLGVQLIAAPWREDLLLRTASSLEAMGVARAPMAAL